MLYALAGWLTWVVAVAILHPPFRGVMVIASFAGLWLVLGLLVLVIWDTVALLRRAPEETPPSEPAPRRRAWLNFVIPAAFGAGIVLGRLLWT